MKLDSAFTSSFADALAALGISATTEQTAACQAHFDLLIEANTRDNLTRITDPAEAAARLYADSAAGLAWARRENLSIESVLDVGSGAGFPAVPLAVLDDTWQVTALEATGKKAAFIDRAARALGIGNLQAIHAHSAHWSPDRRFGLITFKAVGRIDECLKAARPFVEEGGHVALYKTARLQNDEATAGRKAARRCGFEEVDSLDYKLPLKQGAGRFSLRVYRKHG